MGLGGGVAGWVMGHIVLRGLRRVWGAWVAVLPVPLVCMCWRGGAVRGC